MTGAHETGSVLGVRDRLAVDRERRLQCPVGPKHSGLPVGEVGLLPAARRRVHHRPGNLAPLFLARVETP
jgi:hypothetical protein